MEIEKLEKKYYKNDKGRQILIIGYYCQECKKNFAEIYDCILAFKRFMSCKNCLSKFQNKIKTISMLGC